MSATDGPFCACLSVQYKPTKHRDGSQTERWECIACGSEFARRAMTLAAPTNPDPALCAQDGPVRKVGDVVTGDEAVRLFREGVVMRAANSKRREISQSSTYKLDPKAEPDRLIRKHDNDAETDWWPSCCSFDAAKIASWRIVSLPPQPADRRAQEQGGEVLPEGWSLDASEQWRRGAALVTTTGGGKFVMSRGPSEAWSMPYATRDEAMSAALGEPHGELGTVIFAGRDLGAEIANLRATIAERDKTIAELKDYADKCSQASGVYYEADYLWQRGPIDAVVESIAGAQRTIADLHGEASRLRSELKQAENVVDSRDAEIARLRSDEFAAVGVPDGTRPAQVIRELREALRLAEERAVEARDELEVMRTRWDDQKRWEWQATYNHALGGICANPNTDPDCDVNETAKVYADAAHGPLAKESV